MNLDKLYPEDEKYLNKIWQNFIFLNPNCRFVNHKFIREALDNTDDDKDNKDDNKKSFFVEQIRNTFFPDLNNEEAQEEYRNAMNRGIKAVNDLSQEHLEEPEPFIIKEVEAPLELFDFFKAAHYNWLATRDRNYPNPELNFLAYNSIRAFGLGHAVKILEESPEVLNSLRHYIPIIKWFDEKLRYEEVEGWLDNLLGIETPEKVDLEEITQAWGTKAGVKVYGTDISPSRIRLKIFDYDKRELRYGSLIMKMFLKGTYPDDINDHVGVEFLVKDKEDRRELINYFRKILKTSGRMEAFKNREAGKTSHDNKLSSKGFSAVKFIIRPPISVDPLHDLYGFGDRCYERVPIEVQILTLGDDKIRKENPDATHEAYKKRQFMELFPALFPRQIYEPWIKQNL